MRNTHNSQWEGRGQLQTNCGYSHMDLMGTLTLPMVHTHQHNTNKGSSTDRSQDLWLVVSNRQTQTQPSKQGSHLLLGIPVSLDGSHCCHSQSLWSCVLILCLWFVFLVLFLCLSCHHDVQALQNNFVDCNDLSFFTPLTILHLPIFQNIIKNSVPGMPTKISQSAWLLNRQVGVFTQRCQCTDGKGYCRSKNSYCSIHLLC